MLVIGVLYHMPSHSIANLSVFSTVSAVEMYTYNCTRNKIDDCLVDNDDNDENGLSWCLLVDIC